MNAPHHADDEIEGRRLPPRARPRLTGRSHIARFAPNVSSKTLFQYDLPVSPHLAAQVSNKHIPSDHDVLHQCRDYAASLADKAWLFLETAGGVHSPGPSGTTQADLYAPLRLPVVLIGDSRLGGISQTISAFESLRIRGYDVQCVLLFDETTYQNHAYLSRYFSEKHGIPVWGMEQPPKRDASSSPEGDAAAMHRYYEGQSRKPGAAEILNRLDTGHRARVARLGSMARKAHDIIWYPFTQQKHVGVGDITVIDSAAGDYFQTLSSASADPRASGDGPLLQASFDGSASWWTQGLGHANPRLTLAAAHAAGRYGHVMFASAVHEPALALAETLLDGMRNPRLSRVFYSDNGSTGVEVALKMGLRAARLRYADPGGKGGKLGVLGLRGSYHGDTIGAMDCAEPSVFNEKIEWYDGKGFWLDYPTVMCVDGRWRVRVPDSLQEELGRGGEFASLSGIFDLEARERDGGHLVYERFIARTLERLQALGHRFGALVLEPVVLGAGGMALVDPLFQRALVNVVRRSPHLFGRPGTRREAPPEDHADGKEWTGLPVIFDEVFTGLYRLGRFTASSLLGVNADISVHAKLLTGGLVPLCVTLASESIFRAFSSDDKTDALLHGHSYTAHPVGCQVALESVREMQRMDQRGDWDWAKHQDGAPTRESSRDARDVLVWSVWPGSFLERLTRNTERVSGAWALGSVLAIHLRDAAGAGYCSNAAQDLRDSLMRGGAEASEGKAIMWNIHCRVLGNVLYLMAGQTTSLEDVERITSRVEGALR